MCLKIHCQTSDDTDHYVPEYVIILLEKPNKQNMSAKQDLSVVLKRCSQLCWPKRNKFVC